MRKALIIILILLLVISAIFTIAWLSSRNKAVKEGRVAPTFKEFVTRSGQPYGSQTPGSGLSEDGGTGNGPTNEPTNPTDPSPSGLDSPDEIVISEFTSGPLVPGDNVASDNIAGGGGFSNSSTITTGSGLTPAEAPVVPSGSSPNVVGNSSVCSDADLNISFTAEEISRLGALQSEFLSIAGTLRTDADTQAELANYTTFRAKADQATELYNYCQSTAHQIQSPAAFKTRVATPFWRGGTTDKRGYINNGAWKDVIDPREVYTTQSILENLFKLNLW